MPDLHLYWVFPLAILSLAVIVTGRMPAIIREGEQHHGKTNP